MYWYGRYSIGMNTLNIIYLGDDRLHQKYLPIAVVTALILVEPKFIQIVEVRIKANQTNN